MKNQTSFVLTNEGSSEVVSIGVGHCFSYFLPPVVESLFEIGMPSNPNSSSISISYITHGHIFRHEELDTRQGINFEFGSLQDLPTLSSPPFSPASELPNLC